MHAKSFGEERSWIVMIDGPFDERSDRTADEAEQRDSKEAKAEAFQKPEKVRTGHWD